MPSSVLPGWYGKLPVLGDFAGRRLPALFVEPWDSWLASSLASWRERDSGWLDAYLAAPPLRFALGAGVPFSQSPGYAGILMPSVDRVGRYFPLTVVRPRAADQGTAPATWLAALEALAVTALNDDWSAERLDAELGGLDEGDNSGPAWPTPGQTLWWYDRLGEPSTPMASTGLPEPAVLALLFVGHS
jgi:type VI secretion system protein ImpM